jgi:hypothetical protein
MQHRSAQHKPSPAEPDVSVQDAESDLTKLKARATAIEADLARVRAPLEAELARVHADIEEIRTYLKLASRYGERGENRDSVRAPPIQSNGTDKSTISANALPMSDEILAQACRSKSIPDGAIALIRLAGRPLSKEEMADGLRRAGVTFVSDNPANNVHFSLVKKRKDTGAVKLTADKKWTVDESYDPEHETRRSGGFVPNRDRNEHAERTRRGLLAARDRGATPGRRSKITPEMKRAAEEMRAEGISWTEIAKQIGVTPITLQRWREKGIISNGAQLSGLGVSLMITQEQKTNLRNRGYTDEQIRDMKPEDAHRALGLII